MQFSLFLSVYSVSILLHTCGMTQQLEIAVFFWASNALTSWLSQQTNLFSAKLPCLQKTISECFVSWSCINLNDKLSSAWLALYLIQ